LEEVCAPVSEGVIKVLNGTTNSYYAGIGPQPTCENNLTTTVYVHNTPGSHAWEYRTGSFVWKVVHIIDRGWTADPGCEVLLTNPDGDSIVRPTSYECSQGPCETAATISGAWIEQSLLYAANPLASKGISNLAQKVTVQLEPFNTGQMDCWTDPQGEQHCPENTGDRADTCGELEGDPACAYVRQECIQGARDAQSGACYAWTLVYDCGFDTTVGTGASSTLALVCDGVVRCLGTECIEGQFDAGSQDFARAAALMQAVQYVSADTDCSDASAGGCEIFKGRDYDCKKALGGWVDCCTQPEGVSLAHYIKLLGGVHSMASMNWTINTFGPSISNPFSGAYAVLSDAWDYTSQLFTSAWDGLIGNTAEVGTQAIGEAAWLIRAGRAEIAVTGGCEAGISELGLAGFSVMRALTSFDGPPEEASRPFDATRDGFVPCEGAGALILESEAHARARGARIYAEIAGFGCTNDAFHVAAPPDDGEGAARAMAEALRDSGLSPADIDYINAHATSTPLGDTAETRAIKRVFGEDAYRIAISATKSLIGHGLGASGGMETVATIKTIETGTIHPTINLHHPDPDCDLDYVPNVARKAEVRAALKNSFGFGGQNSSLAIVRYEP
ncbi:MAG: conjugal transfer protein TraN, partial [Dehalococcoidia bacterium]|nr:conjugal transfer protein TraN [Dehalococcoidia bacterium]